MKQQRKTQKNCWHAFKPYARASHPAGANQKPIIKMNTFYTAIAPGALIAAGALLHYVIGTWCAANRLRRYIGKRPPRAKPAEDLAPIEWVPQIQVSESNMIEFNRAAKPRSEAP